MSLADLILEETASAPEGAPIFAKALLHLGGRAAIDDALSRLCRSGQLLNIAPGINVRPVTTRFGARPPAPARVIKELASATGERIVPHGATAANALGLSTQIPVRPIFLTSAKSRKLVIGRQEVELRHAPDWQLLLPGEPAGDALRGLAWSGPKASVESVAALRRKLAPSERLTLETLRPQLPGWLAAKVEGLVHDE